MWFFGSNEWKLLGDICTMKEATDKKVVLQCFEEKGLISLCKNFQLFQSCPSCFFDDKYQIFDKCLTEIFFPEYLGKVLPVPNSFECSDQN